jgi:hypothetical protein
VSFAAGVANRLYLASALPARRRLERALQDPAAAQREILARILRENADSEFGRQHGFAGTRSVQDFRERVPASDYDQMAARIERIARGEKRVLTTSEVFCVEPTAGSSRDASKLLPYTRPLLREFSAATMPWIYDLLQHRAALRNGRAYWVVTPPGRPARNAAGGMPIGLEHDSDYFPGFIRALLDRVLGTPRALSRAPTIEASRYLTLRALLALPDLAFVSVWNPSFLSLLAAALDEHWPQLLRDLESGALTVALDEPLRAELSRALPAAPAFAARLRRRYGRRPPEDLGSVWPHLALISCWTEGHASRALAGMRQRFPRVEVQGKGLLATEGVVSIPLFEATGCVAAVASHFLEFMAQGDSDVALGAEELETGRTYEVLLTTSGGLYRYRLMDLVCVTGWYKAVPVLSFRGRIDRTSDVAGEKLSPLFVERVIQDAMAAERVNARFAMLAPAWGAPPCYDLFVECDIADAGRLARAVESRLAASHHYALCRQLGQLGSVREVPVRDGERTYERVCLARGQRAGAIKPASLDERFGWEKEFADGERTEVVA